MRRLSAHQFRTVPGKDYNTPKELWGFESGHDGGTAQETAEAFLHRHADLLGIEREVETLAPRRSFESLGAGHVIMEQRFRDLRIHRAYVTVHVRHGGGVYLAKNRAVPEDVLMQARAGSIGAPRAVNIARRALRGSRAHLCVIGKPEQLWYPARRLLHPAWRVRIHRRKPRSEWIVYVSAEDGRVLDRQDNLALATARARVFAPNPMAGDPSFEPLAQGKLRRPPDKAYSDVRIAGLLGKGKLDGRAVSTELTKHRIRKRNGDYRLKHTDDGFEEVSAYYHLCSGIKRLEELGYTGRRRIFRDVLRVNAHGSDEDNSWYSPGQRTLTFGFGDVDDAEDAETVFHELGHAIQDAICPDFGQSPQAAAMGEGLHSGFALTWSWTLTWTSTLTVRR